MDADKIKHNAKQAWSCIFSTSDMEEAYSSWGLLTGWMMEFMAHDCIKQLPDTTKPTPSETKE